MIPSSVDFELLRLFLLVSSLGNMSRAAESSGRTQSSVSMQIRRLEDLMNCRLLHRTGRGVTLTPDGESLQSYASRIVALGDEVASKLRKPALSGTVRIGLPEEATLAALPAALGQFRRVHPDVSLEVFVDTTAAIEPLWRNGKLDIMIATPSGVNEDALHAWNMELHWVTGRNFSARPNKPLDVVMFAPPCTWRVRMLQTLSDAGVDFRITFTSPSMAAVQAAVSAGLGVTLLTNECVRPSEMSPFELQGLPNDPVYVQYGIYSKRGSAPATAGVVDALATSLNLPTSL